MFEVAGFTCEVPGLRTSETWLNLTTGYSRAAISCTRPTRCSTTLRKLRGGGRTVPRTEKVSNLLKVMSSSQSLSYRSRFVFSCNNNNNSSSPSFLTASRH